MPKHKLKPRKHERRVRERRRTILVPEWRKAWRWASVQIGGIVVLLAGLYDYVPALQKWLPDGKFHTAIVALAVFGILARLYQQKRKEQ